MRKLIYLTALTTTLVACGGGGGGGGSNPPEFTSGASVTVLENRTATGYVATAVGSDEGGVIFSIVGGEDANSFSVDGTTGELTFIAPQNFEAPNDGNGDNSYLLTLQAVNAGGDISTLDLTVNVTNEFNLNVDFVFPSISTNYGGVDEIIVTGSISDSESSVIQNDAIESFTINGVAANIDPENPNFWSTSFPVDQTLRSLEINLIDGNGSETSVSRPVINIPTFSNILETIYDEVAQVIYFIATRDNIGSDLDVTSSLWRFDIGTETFQLISGLDQNLDFPVDNAVHLTFDSTNQRLIYQDDSVFPETIRFIEVDLSTGNRTLLADIENDNNEDNRVIDFVYDETENRGFLTKGGFSSGELFSIDFNSSSLNELLNPDDGERLSDARLLALDTDNNQLYLYSTIGSMPNFRVYDLEQNTLQLFEAPGLPNTSTGKLLIDDVRDRLILATRVGLSLFNKSTGNVEILETTEVNNRIVLGDTFDYGPISDTSIAATRIASFAQIELDQEIVDPSLPNEGVVTPFFPRSGMGEGIRLTRTSFTDESDNLLAINSSGIISINPENGDRSVITSDFPGGSNSSSVDAAIFDQSNNRFFGLTLGNSNNDFADRFSVFEMSSDLDSSTTIISEVLASDTDDRNRNSPVTIGTFNRASLLHDRNRNRVIAAVFRGDATLRYFSIDINTGDRSPIFEDFDVNDSPLFGDDILRIVNETGDSLLILNGERDSLYRLDLVTEEFTVLSDSSLGSGPMGVFASQVSATADFENGRLLIASDNTIHSVDLVTGDRAVLLAPEEMGPSYRSPGSIELSRDGENLYVFHGPAGSVLSIHLASGQKTILSN